LSKRFGPGYKLEWLVIPEATSELWWPLEGKEKRMCANCGCGIPEDKHGDDRNINWSEIVASAEANELSPGQAVANIVEMARKQGEEVT
jgi:hypothetical protein